MADEKGIELVVTGEVLVERPMSQMKGPMKIVEEKSGLKGRLLRPLSAKLLPETDAEKKGIVDREKLYDIHGRRRINQIALAKEFGISYPTPAGGCLLCEKELKKRWNFLFTRGLNDEEIKLIEIGRHFIIDGCWIILGRNEKENKIIENVQTSKVVVPEFIGPSAVILDKCSNKIQDKVDELIKAYSKYKMQSNKTRRKNNREANEIMKIITQSIKEIEYNEAGITVLTKEQQQELTKLSLPLISFLAKNFTPTAKIIITDESTELLDRSVRILNTSFLRD